MTENVDRVADAERVVSASRRIEAPASAVFALIADPAAQPRWDGNDNLDASSSPRVAAVGDVFTMQNRGGKVRENHVVAFVPDREIAWRPAEVGEAPFGQEWRWSIEPIDADSCLVTHTYDWRDLGGDSPQRLAKARATTSDKLMASIDRLASLAEREAVDRGGA